MKKIHIIAGALFLVAGSLLANDQITIERIEVPQEFLDDGGVIQLMVDQDIRNFCDPSSAYYIHDARRPCTAVPSGAFKMSLPLPSRDPKPHIRAMTRGTTTKFVDEIFFNIANGEKYIVVLSDYVRGQDNKNGTIKLKISKFFPDDV